MISEKLLFIQQSESQFSLFYGHARKIIIRSVSYLLKKKKRKGYLGDLRAVNVWSFLFEKKISGENENIGILY